MNQSMTTPTINIFISNSTSCYLLLLALEPGLQLAPLLHELLHLALRDGLRVHLLQVFLVQLLEHLLAVAALAAGGE